MDAEQLLATALHIGSALWLAWVMGRVWWLAWDLSRVSDQQQTAAQPHEQASRAG